MAHECEICGQVCYCDMDDTYFDESPDDCAHVARHQAGVIITDSDAALYDDEDYDASRPYSGRQRQWEND